jgi:hypothetical protein
MRTCIGITVTFAAIMALGLTHGYYFTQFADLPFFLAPGAVPWRRLAAA